MNDFFRLSLAMTTVLFVGCGSDTTDDGCSATALEADSVIVIGVGSAMGPASWPQLPPTAVVAQTYLRLQSTAESRTTFDELNNAIIPELTAAPGLMGVSIRSSAACNTARTLTVWQDEAAMMGFVAGPAHSNAIASVGSVSRGGSITVAGALGTTAVDWSLVSRFGSHDGPVY